MISHKRWLTSICLIVYEYDSLTCLIFIPVNGTGKTWKMVLESPGKCTWKGPRQSCKTTFVILYAPSDWDLFMLTCASLCLVVVLYRRSCVQDNIADYQVEPVQLTEKLLHEKIRSVYDYRCIISGVEHLVYVISLGVREQFCTSLCLLIHCLEWDKWVVTNCLRIESRQLLVISQLVI